MKTIDLRNYVLNRHRKAGFYKGVEIVACGLMGEPNKYWIDLETGEHLTGLTRIEPVETYR